jgi:hypothetical protein
LVKNSWKANNPEKRGDLLIFKTNLLNGVKYGN